MVQMPCRIPTTCQRSCWVETLNLSADLVTREGLVCAYCSITACGLNRLSKARRKFGNSLLGNCLHRQSLSPDIFYSEVKAEEPASPHTPLIRPSLTVQSPKARRPKEAARGFEKLPEAQGVATIKIGFRKKKVSQLGWPVSWGMVVFGKRGRLCVVHALKSRPVCLPCHHCSALISSSPGSI